MNLRLGPGALDAAPQADAAVTAAFAFHGPDGTIRAAGPVARVRPGTSATLESRLAAAIEGAPARAVVGGALPFSHHDREDALWLAADRAHGPWAAEGAAMPACLGMTPEPPPAAYAETVAQALALMAADAGTDRPLDKIVLARSLRLRMAAAIDTNALMRALSTDPMATVFGVALPGGRALVGATPELLVAKAGAQVRSHPLAGSARRHLDPVRDAAACAALAGSDKDRREHAMVAEMILDTLAPLCRRLSAPEGTRLTSTRTMWHLGTRIEGELRDPTMPVALLASVLHPTPAVCGQPRDRAAALIGRLEPVDRSFFAGAVGWCDRAGDGAWHVAIRCAEIAGDAARLYAGAGVVPGSDPEAETAETGAKFGAMLAALGLPRDAALALAE